MHREMTNSSYLLDIQFVISDLMFGELRKIKRFTD